MFFLKRSTKAGIGRFPRNVSACAGRVCGCLRSTVQDVYKLHLDSPLAKAKKKRRKKNKDTASFPKLLPNRLCSRHVLAWGGGGGGDCCYECLCCLGMAKTEANGRTLDSRFASSRLNCDGGVLPQRKKTKSQMFIFSASRPEHVPSKRATSKEFRKHCLAASPSCTAWIVVRS